ncbi:MAG TPA: ABC transporter permease subunit [Tepidisphaeraceae bacterium]|jgi:ABC-type transport system involved in multi-copper enzyme maturation permease subunit|nr:ABC transporter permease subunit [Tepidisphaeraceae bacterium]
MSFATTLQGISPFGPIFGKELRTTARRKRTYFLRVAYLALLLLLLLLVFIKTAHSSRFGGGVALQNQARAELGEMFFEFFSMFSVLVMGILGPVLTSTAIGSERLHKTLPVLLMTPITAWQIVAGKLFSRLLVSLTLIGLSLPVLALVRLLGGVELEQMVGVVGLALLAAVSSAAIGLFFSSLLNRAYAVILLSFAAMFFLYLFIPFVIAMTSRWLYPHGSRMGALRLVLATNPYWLVAAVTDASLWGRRQGPLPWGWCFASHIAMTMGLMVWSASILRRRARREGQARGGAVESYAAQFIPEQTPPGSFVDDIAAAPAVAAPPVIPYASPATRAHPPRLQREVGDNPILWREIRRPLMARRWQRITAVCITVGLLAIVYSLLNANSELDDSDAQSAWACIFNFLIAGIVLVISATAIAQEKESDTWTLLLATPVSGRTIVWGKAIGIARRLFWPMVLVCVHFLLFAANRVISVEAAFITVWIIISFNSVWIATGIYFSLRFSKTTFAVIANLMLAIGAYLLVFLALGLATDIDYVGNPAYPAQIDPQWANLGAVAILCIVSAWLIFAGVRAVFKKRGALGHLMIASLAFYAGLAIFSAKMDWVPSSRLYEQVGWYEPYYFLNQIGRRSTTDLQFWLPSSRGFSNGTTGCLVALVIGLAHLLLAWIVLSMTAWKFSALVGRAPQTVRMTPDDIPPGGRHSPISSALR